MKPFTVPGLLRAAAAYIEIHGHEQRRAHNGGMGEARGPCCPVVAFYRLNETDALRGDAFVAMCRDRKFSASSFGPWSDHTPTAEVLATMRRVAKELDQ